MDESTELISGSLPAALQLLARARSTGVLTVTAGEKAARIALHGGQILCANSAEAGRIGDAMLATGALTAETLDSVLLHQRHKKNKQPLGTILLELDLVTQEVASAAIEAQILRVLREVSDWQEGTYDFEPFEDGLDHTVLPSCGQVETLLLKIAVEEPKPT